MLADSSAVDPFLKWPGGKRWAVPTLLPLARRLLREGGTYYEPFLGGGALFFALRPSRAVLSDINPELIGTYRVVRRCPAKLQAALKNIPVSSGRYYNLRSSAPRSAFHRAVRFLYLDRLAFGGIYRLNRHGRFNVPYNGGTRGTDILWRTDTLAQAARVLRKARLSIGDFSAALDLAGTGDLVYCDPTYTVAHNNNCFVRYNENNFRWADQIRLASAAKGAVERGASVMITNADHHSIISLYRGWPILRLARHSSVSTNPAKRRTTTELVVILAPDKLSLIGATQAES